MDRPAMPGYESRPGPETGIRIRNTSLTGTEWLSDWTNRPCGYKFCFLLSRCRYGVFNHCRNFAGIAGRAFWQVQTSRSAA